MKGLAKMAVAFFALGPSMAVGQNISESWLRVAASACGGGISLEAAGEFEAILLKRFKAVEGGAEASLDVTDLKRLLDQFDNSERSAEAKSYRECLLTLANMAIETSGLPPREVTLTSPIAISPLETVRRGERFVLATGESIAIGNHAIIFSLDAIFDEVRPRLAYTYSNSETGEGKSVYAYQAQVVQLGEACSVVPYKIDVKGGAVSFIANC